MESKPMNSGPRILAWFSCGITSAVACKLAVEQFGVEQVEMYYIHIDSAHKDNERFIRECEEWIGSKVNVVTSEKYSDQFDVINKDKYVNGPSGARCTLKLKKEIRWKLEKTIDFTHQVFGFEFSLREINRAIRFEEQYPHTSPIFPLIDKNITKEIAASIVESAGIELPFMYRLGYSNNNCIGCVKGGKGYWNKIREDFPLHFAKMAKAERSVGRSCIKGKFLDDLHPSEGYSVKPITPSCDVFCGVEFEDLISTKAKEKFNGN